MGSLKRIYLRIVYESLVALGVAFLFLYLVGLNNFLLFRILIEFFNAAVSFAIFMMAWNSRKITESGFFIFIGAAYLFIGALNAVRIFAFPELSLIPGAGVNLSQQLRTASLCMESVSFFIAFVFMERKFPARTIMVAYGVAFMVIFVSIFYGQKFPDLYVGGMPTSFKFLSDRIIILVLALSVAVLYKKKRLLDPLVAGALFWAISFQIASIVIHVPFSLEFTAGNFTSQCFRFISYFFLYKAAIETGLAKPYRIIFKKLKDREKRLFESNQKLEMMVAKRTADLARTNLDLMGEISQRKRAERELIDSYRYLGSINRRISLLLELSKGTYHGRKKEVLRYIINSALSFSDASYGMLYFRLDGNFYMVSSVNVEDKHLRNIKFVNVENCGILGSMLKEKNLVRGLAKRYDLGKLDMRIGTQYFIALPLVISRKINGFLFLGFCGRRNLENHEIEFLDVFTNNSSLALFNAGILSWATLNNKFREKQKKMNPAGTGNGSQGSLEIRFMC